jgi:hypothetical protein
VSSSGEVGGRVAKFSEGERMGKGQGEQIPDGPSASQDLIAGWMGSASEFTGFIHWDGGLSGPVRGSPKAEDLGFGAGFLSGVVVF